MRKIESQFKVKGGFSDSSGIAPYSVGIQTLEFDKRTRNILSNTLFDILKFVFEGGQYQYKIITSGFGNPGGRAFGKYVLSDLFAERIDGLSERSFQWEGVYSDYIYKIIAEGPYNEVLDIIEATCRWLYYNMIPTTEDYFKVLNDTFEFENVGYRFVDRRIVAITDENEIAEINLACNCKYDGCKIHMKKAAGFLSDREKKDYKNSIKESICAVESACQIITGDNNATLGDGIKKLKKNGVVIHPALETAFSKLYGYTSDQGGVRHAEGLFESKVSFEDAKYMLVSCSAFLNYLISVYEKSGTQNYT